MIGTTLEQLLLKAYPGTISCAACKRLLASLNDMTAAEVLATKAQTAESIYQRRNNLSAPFRLIANSVPKGLVLGVLERHIEQAVNLTSSKTIDTDKMN